jgi:Icc-related predicted phosphoesterase
MIIDCIADLHGYYPKLDGGDLLIVAGDLTASDQKHQYAEFATWLERQDYKKRIIVAGNHDNTIHQHPFTWSEYSDSAYLCDSGSEFEYTEPVRNLFDSEDNSLVYRKKLKIWGSPWTLTFDGMNPRCKAFTVDTEKELAEKWAMIPDDIDILVTHSPPCFFLDRTIDNRIVGSRSLNHQTACHIPQLKIHVFGHIHESYGRMDTDFIRINASHVNEYYQPVNPPIRVTL